MALLSSDSVRAWRAVDYPWVLASFMTILVAVTNIQESTRSQLLSQAIDARQSSYGALLYQIRSVVVNDCHPKPTRMGMWRPSPEPYIGACDRIEHFLPQIERAAEDEKKPEQIGSGGYWGKNLIISEEQAVGTWQALYRLAGEFSASATRATQLVARADSIPRSPLAPLSRSEDLKYWFYALAYLLGLRLSRVTADLLGPRVREDLRAYRLVRRLLRMTA